MKELIDLFKRVIREDQGALLKKEYQIEGEHYTFGYCYIASEALYHYMGGKDSNLTPVCGRDDNGIVHWWLRDNRGNIFDITREQYTSKGETPPYDKGRACGFIGSKISKRAKALLEILESKEESSVCKEGNHD